MLLEHVPLSETLYYYLHDFWEKEGDPRIGDRLFFRGGPLTVWSIILFYVVFVKKLGPALMKNRPAYSLRSIMLSYNLIMILVNAYFFYEIVFNFNFGMDMHMFEFNRPDKNDYSSKNLRIVTLAHYFFISKLVDLIETVFFVLRKKHNQISNLHVYHHSAVPILVHLSVKIAPVGGPATLFPLLNTLVHIIMYTYYALAALGPHVQKYLWWKKYITQIQLLQFVLFFLHSILFYYYESGYPPVFKYLGFSQPPLFFWLFYKFYTSSYKHKNLNNSCSKSNNLNNSRSDRRPEQNNLKDQ